MNSKNYNAIVSNADRLAALYLEWVNSFLSVERFAEYYSFSLEQAQDVIARGKAHHEAAAVKTRVTSPLDGLDVDPQTPEELIDAAQSILELCGVSVDLRESAPEDPTPEDAAAVVHVATLALESWNDREIAPDLATSAHDVIVSWVENMQDEGAFELPAAPYDLDALKAEALMTWAHARGEKARSVPELTPLTVIVNTDNREWDDPVVMFIDARTPLDVRAAVEAEYTKTLGDWAADGAVILGIMRGHIQLGWDGYNGGNGLQDRTIADAFNNFGVTAS